MSKPVWFCRELGTSGWLMLAADLDLSAPDEPENMLGHRRSFHPFQLDEDPEALARVLGEMSEVMGRVSAPPLSSRACAFGPGDEAPRG